MKHEHELSYWVSSVYILITITSKTVKFLYSFIRSRSKVYAYDCVYFKQRQFFQGETIIIQFYANFLLRSYIGPFFKVK